ncbi:MAG: PA0069 family radical SAM protein [Methylotetracoccus sp.]
MRRPPAPIKGRGAVGNPGSRYDRTTRERDEDLEEETDVAAPETRVTSETIRSIITRNSSPDIPFDRSINPYRGCEHGCIYCYARPAHAYLGLSPGLDFETRLVAKSDVAEVLERELARPNYVCRPIALGANTDPYQPIERHYRSTRQILEVLHDWRHPVTITTKSSLIERDLDLLATMAADGLAEVQISVTTLEPGLARVLEPRATAPARRLQTVAALAGHGIPVRVMIAPVIPFINDAEIETILAESARHQARDAGYIVLRLPLEVADLFREWLETHFPQRATRVLHCVEEIHGGRIYDSRFGVRQSGSGRFAELLRQRFQLARRRHGLEGPLPRLACDLFRPPARPGGQLDLFD